MKVVKKIKQEKFQCTCASDLEKKRENEKKVRDMEEKYNAQKTMLRKKDKEIREVIKVVKRKVGIFQLWSFPRVLCIEKYVTLDIPHPHEYCYVLFTLMVFLRDQIMEIEKLKKLLLKKKYPEYIEVSEDEVD